MPRRPTLRQLDRLVYIFVLGAVLVMGWKVWRVVAASVAKEAGARNFAVPPFTTLPASPGGLAGEPSNSAYLGGPAPDFSLTLFETGGSMTLSDLRGQPVILDFFASWCPSCRAEAPSLQEFWQAYQDKGLTLLGVALSDSVEGVQDFRDEFVLTYPMGLDETGEIAAKYRVGSIPTFVFIDSEGRIANVIVGTMSENAMAIEAESLLK